MLEGKGESTARIHRAQTARWRRGGCATKPSDSAGRAFKLADAVLDRASVGPLWLKDSRIARCVMDAIHFGETKLGFYSLHAFVIMPNHAHLLITPRVAVSRLMNGLKGITAREANCILRSKGKHFWQDESFDHWVRSSREFDRIQAYIEFNPVSAGLANKPEAWPWSSATRITAEFPAQTSSGGC
jgi:REP element-mobilizing transposase RayT